MKNWKVIYLAAISQEKQRLQFVFLKKFNFHLCPPQFFVALTCLHNTSKPESFIWPDNTSLIQVIHQGLENIKRLTLRFIFFVHNCSLKWIFSELAWRRWVLLYTLSEKSKNNKNNNQKTLSGHLTFNKYITLTKVSTSFLLYANTVYCCWPFRTGNFFSFHI